MADNSKGWADSDAAGAMALSIAVFGFFAVLTGRVEGSGIILLSMWLIGGFVVHIVVGIMKLLSGNTVEGNAFTFFASFLMLASALDFMIKWMVMQNGWTIDTRMSGYVWIPLWLTTWLWTPAIWRKLPLVFDVAILFMDIAFPFVCLTNLKVLDPAYASIAGYCLLLTGILTLWLGTAGMVNAAFGRTILPVGEPICRDKTIRCDIRS